jgi:cell pole-organizing protein PopZ
MSGAKEPTKPGGQQDPAMDDILASIRRILNEDDVPPGAAAATGSPTTASAAAAAEPIDLTESMLVQPPVAPMPPEAAVEPAAEPAPEAEAAPTEPGPAAIPAEVLVAPAVAAATTAAMGKLLRAVVQERSATVSRGGPSIEDVVREEIRPLLKEWLDHHLPPLVERLVRAEIERVVGRNL